MSRTYGRIRAERCVRATPPASAAIEPAAVDGLQQAVVDELPG